MHFFTKWLDSWLNIRIFQFTISSISKNRRRERVESGKTLSNIYYGERNQQMLKFLNLDLAKTITIPGSFETIEN